MPLKKLLYKFESEGCLLEIDAGTIIQHDEDQSFRIEPPPVLMFDQLLSLFEGKSGRVDSNQQDERTTLMGIAALIMHGSYFCILVPQGLSLHPKARQGYSMITDGEMKRLNIEMSAVIARLIQLRYQHKEEFFSLIWAATRLFPYKLNHSIRPSRPGGILNAYTQIPLEEKNTTNITYERACRIAANVLVYEGIRNSKLEDIHSGKFTPLDFNHRRMTVRQEQGLFNRIAEQVGQFFLDPILPGWPKSIAGLDRLTGYYPIGWSLTKNTALVEHFPLDGLLK
jgi:hypothetical protein